MPEQNQPDALASEAGNTTRDRQPADPDAVEAGDREGPADGGEASGEDVRKRSATAAAHHASEHDQADKLHPGPNLDPGETKRDTRAG